MVPVPRPLAGCTKCQVISNRREQMSEMLFGLVNSNCVRVLETVAGCPCCKCQMISLCCRYSCCLWLLTCPATNDPNPCHMLCRLPLPLPLTTATTTRATLTQFQLQSCGPAQATSVRLFNEISKHCKCVQLSKCCTHPSPHSSSCCCCLDSFTFMGTCNEACRGYNPITVKMGIAKSRL